MNHAYAALLILGTIQYSWLLDDDSEQVASTRARLEHIIRQTGKYDPRPTVIVEHKTYAAGSAYECVISDLATGKKVWRGVGDTPRGAAREAFADYWGNFK